MTSLLQEPAARFDSVDVLWKALQDCAEARPGKRGSARHVAGFADAMIIRKATDVMTSAGEHRPIAHTFDVGAQQLPTRDPLNNSRGRDGG